MEQKRRYILRMISMCLVLLVFPFCAESVGAKDFVLVIDAGHGGHDPGAVGKYSKEKQINLDVALKLGRLVRASCPDVKVVYTRDKDVFLSLARRAEIANNAKADLFISIHTNALPGNKTARGTSTWTLGLAKSTENLDVAKRENSVILYEDDYRTRYAGFDPDSAESYIIFEFMQDKYMSQSVHLASLVQQQMKTVGKRNDHGVHQAGFLVLKASAMPSVLIELGYLSTPAEERYMNTEAGTASLADAIFRAFCIYKQEQAAHLNEGGVGKVHPVSGTTVPPELAEAGTRDGIVFKVQILAASHRLPDDDKRLKGLEGVEYYEEKGLYKYTYGASPDYNEVLRIRKSVSGRFKDAFVVAFKDGRKMDINAAIREFKQSKK